MHYTYVPNLSEEDWDTVTSDPHSIDGFSDLFYGHPVTWWDLNLDSDVLSHVMIKDVWGSHPLVADDYSYASKAWNDYMSGLMSLYPDDISDPNKLGEHFTIKDSSEHRTKRQHVHVLERMYNQMMVNILGKIITSNVTFDVPDDANFIGTSSSYINEVARNPTENFPKYARDVMIYMNYIQRTVVYGGGNSKEISYLERGEDASPWINLYLDNINGWWT